MPAPKVIYHRDYTDPGHPDCNQVMEAGNTYNDVCERACCQYDLNITEIAWEADYGSYGTMKIVVATDSCSYPGACGSEPESWWNRDPDAFYLSPDGVTKGTKSVDPITGAGTYYIVAAESDLPAGRAAQILLGHLLK